MEYKRQKILMTGATGFLGSNLLKKLVQDGYAVIILKRSFSNLFRIKDYLSKIKYYDIDVDKIGDIVSANKIDAILHCATNYGRKEYNPLSIIESNLVLPLKLLELASKNKIPCFINTDTILDTGIDYYSLSKKQFKDWLEKYSLKMVCVNIALEHFYGAFDDKTKFVSYVIDKILNNAPSIDLTKGEQKRDFVYIDDVVEAFVGIIDNISALGKGFYNYEVGTNHACSIKDLVILIKDLCGNNATKLNFGAIPYRKNEIMEAKADTREIRALGWNPKIMLKDGLLKTIELEKVGRGNR